MRPPGSVRWTQGMFLLPQHFQQGDLFQHAERSYLAHVLHPFPWGLHSLSVEEEALKTEVFRIRACELVYPDGVTLRFPESARIEAASFKEAFKPNQDRLGVYLSLPDVDARAGGRKRFATASEPRIDLYPTRDEAGAAGPPADAAEDERLIDYAVPQAKLVFTNDPKDGALADSQSVKVAEIRRTGAVDRPYDLSKDYVAPVLRVDASEVLKRLLRGLHEQLRGAASVLAQYRRGAEGVAYGVGDLHQLLALQVVNHLLPGLQHALSHGGSHPFPLYGLLAEGRGALTTYCAPLREDAADFPQYNHTDLAGCFGPLIDSIRRHIDHLLPTQFEEVHLDRDGDLFWGPITHEDLLRTATAFVIAVRGPGSEEESRRRVERFGKITSSRDMPEIIASNLRGVPFRYLDYPPAELPLLQLRGYGFYGIETKDTKWRTVRDDLDICFYLPDAEAEVQARLFAVLPRGRES